ncbi:abortive infection system antitoxin AbiGi family protein [Cyclobacterium roseum]|uniref:abortive infection system antitoxin AbiGi family protein n=1 Tax=Cyclobacterium roseum TaxID=2666137 RepID=UPI0013907919|nr:abortive infection system antitoxin AbiGi family protein [Cyclobacterium roseum]
MIAGSLFHFTNDLKTLQIILESQRLRASYNIEDIRGFYPDEQFLAIPMVCFCDIPLKNVSDNHTEIYGVFGLGFKKVWGIKNGINPIMYRTENSFIEQYILTLTGETQSIFVELEKFKKSQELKFVSEFENINLSINNLKSCALNLAGFIKIYEDSLAKGVNYYLEREWRWVPGQTEKIFSASNSKQTKIDINKIYHKNPDFLNFTLDDLRYVIVEKKSDIVAAVSLIGSFSISEMEKGMLIQKIIDIESINQDM